MTSSRPCPRPAFLCFAFFLILLQMAIIMLSNSCTMHLKAPFVDSSNRTSSTTNPKLHHTHLHSSLLPPKIPSHLYCPPCERYRRPNRLFGTPCDDEFPFVCSTFLVSFPTDANDDTSCRDPSPATEALRRPPARTSSLEPPRRPYAPKSHAACVPIRKQPPFTSPYSAPRCASSPASIKSPTADDLRLTALIEHSIASTLFRYADNPNS
jgi:hypothetical protein